MGDLDSALDSWLGLTEPSIPFSLLAAVCGINAIVHAVLIEKTTSVLVTKPVETMLRVVNLSLLSASCFYIVLRFPTTLFTAPPTEMGRAMFIMATYSFLFTPLWLTALVMTPAMAISISRSTTLPSRKQLMLIAFAILLGLGVIGEVRMLLDPTAYMRIYRTPV
jgi:hypothetical protein